MMTTIYKTIFAILSKPERVPRTYPDTYHIINYIHINESNETYDFNLTCDWLNMYNINKIVLINVTRNPKLFEIDIKKHVGYKTNTTIIEFIIPSYKFWTIEGISKFIFQNLPNIFKAENIVDYNVISVTENKNSPYFILYKFEDTTWFEIVSLFKYLNITTSGGNIVKRNINSPLQAQLNLFMQCLERENFLKKKTWNSFHNISYISNRIWYNYNLDINKINELILKWESLILQIKELEEIEYTEKDIYKVYKININEIKKIIELLKIVKDKIILDNYNRNEKNINETNNSDNLTNSKKLNNKSFSNIQKRSYHTLNKNINNDFDNLNIIIKIY